MVIGVVALQGAFIEHIKMLQSLGVDTFEIRQKSDLSKPMDGMILPGGESTAIGKLLIDLDMMDSVGTFIKNGMPILGTCAGMVLLAKDIVNSPVTHLATMDISVLRNAYGRQLGSFFTVSKFGDCNTVPMTFIRAPYIEKAQKNVKILSTVNGHIVAAQQGNQLVTSFHPELTTSTVIHKYFLDIVKNRL